MMQRNKDYCWGGNYCRAELLLWLLLLSEDGIGRPIFITTYNHQVNNPGPQHTRAHPDP